METNIRVSVSGVSEAEQQLRKFSGVVSELSRNAQSNVQGGAMGVEEVIKQVTQKIGGIDPFRSGKDYSKFTREVQESYITPLEGKRASISSEIKSVESFRSEIEKQNKSGQLSEEEYVGKLEELNKETEFYKNELENVTNSLKSFGDILQDVGRVNQEILSGERDKADAMRATRKLGELENLGLTRARNEYLFQRETSPAQRNILANEQREALKNLMDLRSEKILTTNQRAIVNPAMGGGANIANAIGGGVGGSFGEITETSMNLIRDIREIFTLDLARAAGAVITAGTNLVASYAKMTIPKMIEREKAQQELSMVGQFTGGSALNLGMNIAETNRALQSQYRAIGRGDAGLGMKAMDLEVGAGVGLGGFGGLFQSFKYYSQENQNLISQVGKAVDIISKSGLINTDTWDFARMQEASQLISNVDAMQTGRFRNVDIQASASVVGGLESLGGTFRGQSGMGKFQAIDESIRNPKNDFVRATLFRALMAENPNMSMLDLEKRMEAGAMGEGNLDAFIKQIGKQSGVDTSKASTENMLSNEVFVRNLRVATGLNYADTEGLIRGGRGKTGKFDVFDKREGDSGTGGKLTGRARTVDEITAMNKELENILSTQGGDMAKEYLRNTVKFAKDPNKFFEDMIKNATDTISNKTSEFFNGLGKTISGFFGFSGSEENKQTQSKTPKTEEERKKALEANTEALNKTARMIEENNKMQGVLTPNKVKKGIKE